MLPAICYGLLVVAWGIDLVTPQLFVAAILLNGPIALSSLALRPQLTMRLMVLAELANVVAAYVNGVQAGHHWDAIALGDRALLAASFLLVGILTMRAQENAHRAGEADERGRQVEHERALRHAMEHVRASLNMELVLRAAVREALLLARSDCATVFMRSTSLDVPTSYSLESGGSDIEVAKAPLTPEMASLIERARERKRVVAIDPGDPLGRLLGSAALVASLDIEGVDIALVLTWSEHVPTTPERVAVQNFVDNLGVALAQARLFIQLAEQNEEIARQRDVIRDIVYALAHDLRTPLVAADLTLTQALSGAYGDLPESYRKVAATSVASNADLRRLVETLLLVARYEAGEDSRASSMQALRPILERVLDELRPMAEVKGVHLALESSIGPLELSVDADELRRAVINLAANAVDATPQHGHVSVGATQDGDRIRIDVVDDGFGVPPERRAALFQRFGGVRGGGGTGLGLYIVRRIAEKYGGVAEYAPREPRGSRFSLVIPRTGASA